MRIRMNIRNAPECRSPNFAARLEAKAREAHKDSVAEHALRSNVLQAAREAREAAWAEYGDASTQSEREAAMERVRAAQAEVSRRMRQVRSRARRKARRS